MGRSMQGPLRATPMDWDSDYIRNFVAMVVEQDRAASAFAAATLLPAPQVVQARILAKDELAYAGLPLAERICRTLDREMQISLLAQDGQEVRRDDAVMALRGHADAILKTECTAWHVLEHLSGIATRTRRFAEEARSEVCDSEKSTTGGRSSLCAGCSRYSPRGYGPDRWRDHRCYCSFLRGNGRGLPVLWGVGASHTACKVQPACGAARVKVS
jgi:Quinolinate phosphoribosyl transferase, N-terminal domain